MCVRECVCVCERECVCVFLCIVCLCVRVYVLCLCGYVYWDSHSTSVYSGSLPNPAPL